MRRPGHAPVAGTNTRAAARMTSSSRDRLPGWRPGHVRLVKLQGRHGAAGVSSVRAPVRQEACGQARENGNSTPLLSGQREAARLASHPGKRFTPVPAGAGRERGNATPRLPGDHGHSSPGSADRVCWQRMLASSFLERPAGPPAGGAFVNGDKYTYIQ